jgi:chitinase
MSRDYYDRYQFFIEDGEFQIVPGIELPIKGTDKYIQYTRAKNRLDKLSQEYYNSPTFGWLIMLANPQAGTNEFEIPNNFLLRIPFPLVNTLQDYRRGVELYKLYYGE